MNKITKEQIKRLYALGSQLQLVDSGDKNDRFHMFIYAETQRESVRDLTESEFKSLEKHFLLQLNPLEYVPGKMTKKQQSKAWKLMYEIIELNPRDQTVGQRMCGAIKRNFYVDVDVRNPFKWLTFEQGNILIEQLKRYKKSVERKLQVGDSG